MDASGALRHGMPVCDQCDFIMLRCLPELCLPA